MSSPAVFLPKNPRPGSEETSILEMPTVETKKPQEKPSSFSQRTRERKAF